MLRYGKDRYIQMLIDNGDMEGAAEKAALDEYEPLFKKRLIHPEETPVIKDYNTMILEAKNDLSMLHYEIMSGSQELKRLADSIMLRLENVKHKLLQEKEIRDDMKMLCNAYNDFDNLIIVDEHITTRTCDYQKGVFKAKASRSQEVPYEVISVDGNGQEGNEYVLKDKNTFLKDSFATDIQKAFMDNDLQTYYEYQRICIDEDETLYAPYMYKDVLPARCNIVLEAAEIVNECQINGNVFLLNGLYFSHNDTDFSNALLQPIKLDNSQTIESTGFQAFPSGKFIKFSCESIDNAYQDKIGIIAYKGDETPSQNDENGDKTRNLEIEDTKPETGDTGYDDTTYIYPIESAKRKVIRLNEIKLMRSLYENNTYFTTNNLLSYPVQSVALYADVYIPNHFSEKDCVEFELSVNGMPFKVVPINTDFNGIKVIKTSTLELGAHYSEYVKEPITDVKLTTHFKCPNQNESAVIKHVRLLVGEKYEN